MVDMTEHTGSCDWCGENAIGGTWIMVQGENLHYGACEAHMEYLGLLKGAGPQRSAATPKRKPKLPVARLPSDWEAEVKSALYESMIPRDSAILNAERLAPIVLAGFRVAHREGVAKAIASLRMRK